MRSFEMKEMIKGFKYAISKPNHFIYEIIGVSDAYVVLRDIHSTDQTMLSHKQFLDLWVPVNEEGVAKELLGK
jgi:hypothetical protein